MIGDGTVIAFAVFALIGLEVGHLFGGPDPENRSVLALANASPHPGVAIAVGATLFPGQKLVALAVLLSLIVGSIISIPYTLWRKRQHRKLTVSALP